MEPVDIDPRDGGGPTAVVALVPLAPWRVSTSALYEWLEGRFGIGAVAPAACIADSGRGPRVILRGRLVGAPGSTGVATLACTRVAAEATGVSATEATLTTLSAGALGAVDFGVGVAQARADFIDLKLDNSALLAFF